MSSVIRRWREGWGGNAIGVVERMVIMIASSSMIRFIELDGVDLFFLLSFFPPISRKKILLDHVGLN